ncbi:response regulator transcription factor [Glycomyces harbinensis]|uniref:DNA-binding response regulator, NarL/FixJ family, contains REC and HTH domains n=1 Tax=Glycomyces harbinensis TaxID=58114 RepID=A0A1G6Y7S7_9ACTN|nr:response regulator transcription factor [Glycomyces harbinensis]SDD86420.1 DNA-binding response regulator, NarL/FixJ family, contains REC and HTH domains [Glycomyces harbinensis]
MRVVIAEDSVLLREGLARLIEIGGMEVIDTVGDAEALLRSVERDCPDLVVADVRMPPDQSDEGVRAALVLRRRYPDLAILMLSQYVEERYAVDLLTGQMRGIGYLLKDRVADVAEFLDSLRRVAGGGTALDPEVISQLLVRRDGDELDRLTPREREVLSHMAEGRSNAGIAEALFLSEGAVSKHINSMFTKLGLPPSDSGNRRVLAILKFLQGNPKDRS